MNRLNETNIMDISHVTVPASVIADIIGLTERRVRQLGEGGNQQLCTNYKKL